MESDGDSNENNPLGCLLSVSVAKAKSWVKPAKYAFIVIDELSFEIFSTRKFCPPTDMTSPVDKLLSALISSSPPHALRAEKAATTIAKTLAFFVFFKISMLLLPQGSSGLYFLIASPS